MKGRKTNGSGPSKGIVMPDPAPKTVYAGEGSGTEKAALKRKRGGSVKHVGGPEGKASKMRLDRPGRKTGGRVGADTAPLSSAARVSKPAGLDLDD